MELLLYHLQFLIVTGLLQHTDSEKLVMRLDKLLEISEIRSPTADGSSGWTIVARPAVAIPAAPVAPGLVFQTPAPVAYNPGPIFYTPNAAPYALPAPVASPTYMPACAHHFPAVPCSVPVFSVS